MDKWEHLDPIYSDYWLFWCAVEQPLKWGSCGWAWVLEFHGGSRLSTQRERLELTSLMPNQKGLPEMRGPDVSTFLAKFAWEARCVVQSPSGWPEPCICRMMSAVGCEAGWIWFVSYVWMDDEHNTSAKRRIWCLFSEIRQWQLPSRYTHLQATPYASCYSNLPSENLSCVLIVEHSHVAFSCCVHVQSYLFHQRRWKHFEAKQGNKFKTFTRTYVDAFAIIPIVLPMDFTHVLDVIPRNTELWDSQRE